MHLVITDSGLGGLSVCAGLEKALRGLGGVRLTYVNAWPEQGRGYNDLPDMEARAAVFERVLQSMAAMQPDAILIACNTLSIVFEHTSFRTQGRVPVGGIVDGGVRLFRDALMAHPGAALVLIGTRTTIESGVHKQRLVNSGISATRISAASCHGLATAIEGGPDSESTNSLVATCLDNLAAAAPQGDPLLLGLACTHYGMIADRLASGLAERTGRQVLTLDPNAWMVADAASRFGTSVRSDNGSTAVEVLSRVELSHDQREGIAHLLESVSPATAAALRAYTHLPNLF